MSDKRSYWIGMAFDGLLAHWEPSYPDEIIGQPIDEGVARLKAHRNRGEEVRIVTARVAMPPDVDTSDTRLVRQWERHIAAQRSLLTIWCREHLGFAVVITAQIDRRLRWLYAPYAVQMDLNTGERPICPGCGHACTAGGTDSTVPPAVQARER